MPKFVYFPLHARGSAIKMLLAHGKVEFEDEQITFDQWPARKATGEFPNGQLPVWIQDGNYYNESKAILRFLGA